MVRRPLREHYPARRPDAPHATLLHGNAQDALVWARLHALHPTLVYLDPPYQTGRTFHYSGQAVDDERTFAYERVAYIDREPEGLTGYLHTMRPILQAAHAALTTEGSLLVHADHRVTPYVAVFLDELFGPGDRVRANSPGFRNELVWTYGLGGSSRRVFARKHDTILWYSRGADWYFDPPRVPATSNRLAGQLKNATDVLDVPAINNQAAERTGWPTQKPLALLRMLVEALSPRGALVADPFGGSGTTAVAAIQTGRNALSVDLSDDAIHLQRQRLLLEGAAVTLVRLAPPPAQTTHVTLTRDHNGSLRIVSPVPLVFAVTGRLDANDTLVASAWWSATRRNPGGTLLDASCVCTLPHADDVVLVRNLDGHEELLQAPAP